MQVLFPRLIGNHLFYPSNHSHSKLYVHVVFPWRALSMKNGEYGGKYLYSNPRSSSISTTIGLLWKPTLSSIMMELAGKWLLSLWAAKSSIKWEKLWALLFPYLELLCSPLLLVIGRVNERIMKEMKEERKWRKWDRYKEYWDRLKELSTSKVTIETTILFYWDKLIEKPCIRWNQTLRNY
jgi:hypothetical protein